MKNKYVAITLVVYIAFAAIGYAAFVNNAAGALRCAHALVWFVFAVSFAVLAPAENTVIYIANKTPEDLDKIKTAWNIDTWLDIAICLSFVWVASYIYAAAYGVAILNTVRFRSKVLARHQQTYHN